MNEEIYVKLKDVKAGIYAYLPPDGMKSQTWVWVRHCLLHAYDNICHYADRVVVTEEEEWMKLPE